MITDTEAPVIAINILKHTKERLKSLDSNIFQTLYFLRSQLTEAQKIIQSKSDEVEKLRDKVHELQLENTALKTITPSVRKDSNSNTNILTHNTNNTTTTTTTTTSKAPNLIPTIKLDDLAVKELENQVTQIKAEIKNEAKSQLALKAIPSPRWDHRKQFVVNYEPARHESSPVGSTKGTINVPMRPLSQRSTSSNVDQIDLLDLKLMLDEIEIQEARERDLKLAQKQYQHEMESRKHEIESRRLSVSIQSEVLTEMIQETSQFTDEDVFIVGMINKTRMNVAKADPIHVANILEISEKKILEKRKAIEVLEVKLQRQELKLEMWKKYVRTTREELKQKALKMEQFNEKLRGIKNDVAKNKNGEDYCVIQ